MTVILPAPFSPRAPSSLTSFLTEDGRAQLCVTPMRECAIVLCVCRFTETIGSGVASFPYPSECFTNGRKRIVYAETHMNKHSSRSHCLLQLRVNRVARPTPGEGGGRGEEGPGSSEHSTLVHTRRRADVDCQTTVQFRVFRAWLDRRYHHVETPRRRRSSVVVRKRKICHYSTINRQSRLSFRGWSLQTGDASAAAAAVTAAAAKNVVQQTQGLLTVVGNDPSDASSSVCLSADTPPTPLPHIPPFTRLHEQLFGRSLFIPT